MRPGHASVLIASLATACQSPAPAPEVVARGTVREVLRDGRSEGRVRLTEVVRPTTVGVGALAGLRGEVTIADGVALVAIRRGGSCDVRPAQPGEQAALLVTAEVAHWSAVPLPACDDYAALERAIAGQLDRAGFDRGAPVPVRIRGRAPAVAFHVIDGACPIADPDGPPPWRHRGGFDQVELVGFYVEGAVGRLTHHGRSSHLHVIAGGWTGHLDELALEEGVLMLPAR